MRALLEISQLMQAGCVSETQRRSHHRDALPPTPCPRRPAPDAEAGVEIRG
ncbi:MAG: hypothetical protein AAFR52_03120 [Pseudomonadota bacterium]